MRKKFVLKGIKQKILIKNFLFNHSEKPISKNRPHRLPEAAIFVKSFPLCVNITAVLSFRSFLQIFCVIGV